MLTDKISDFYQIFTFPRKLAQVSNSAISPTSPLQTPVTPIAPYSMSRDGTINPNGDAENPVSPTLVKPETDKRRLTFDQPPPYPSYLRILKQVAAFIILFLSGAIIIGSIHDYTRYEVTTNIEIRRTPPPYHITLCLDVPDIIISSKLPLELQTKLSALKSKSRSEFIKSANEEISNEMSVEQINQVTPSLIQVMSSIKLGDEAIPVDNQHVITFFKGLSKCFTVKLEHLNWYKFFETNLVVRFRDKGINNVKVYIHYDNLIHGDRRSYKLVNFNSGGATAKVVLSYRIVRRMFLPPPYVTSCFEYAHQDDVQSRYDSKAAAVDTCVMKRTMVTLARVPDHLVQPMNSTIKFTTVKGWIHGDESGQPQESSDVTKSIVTNATKECLDLFRNPDCIDDTVFIYETEREAVTPDMTDYEPEIVITNPKNDFTTIQYVPLKTLSDEIFAATGAIGFLVASFLLISYLSKVVLRVCNKK